MIYTDLFNLFSLSELFICHVSLRQKLAEFLSVTPVPVYLTGG